MSDETASHGENDGDDGDDEEKWVWWSPGWRACYLSDKCNRLIRQSGEGCIAHHSSHMARHRRTKPVLTCCSGWMKERRKGGNAERGQEQGEGEIEGEGGRQTGDGFAAEELNDMLMESGDNFLYHNFQEQERALLGETTNGQHGYPSFTHSTRFFRFPPSHSQYPWQHPSHVYRLPSPPPSQG